MAKTNFFVTVFSYGRIHTTDYSLYMSTILEQNTKHYTKVYSLSYCQKEYSQKSLLNYPIQQA